MPPPYYNFPPPENNNNPQPQKEKFYPPSTEFKPIGLFKAHPMTTKKLLVDLPSDIKEKRTRYLNFMSLFQVRPQMSKKENMKPYILRYFR